MRAALEFHSLQQPDDFEGLADAKFIVMPGAPQRAGFTVPGVVDATALRTTGGPVNGDQAVRGSRKVADELLLSKDRGCASGRLRPHTTGPQCRDRHSNQ